MLSSTDIESSTIASFACLLIAAEFALPALVRTLKQLLALLHLQGTILSNSTTFCGVLLLFSLLLLLLYQYCSAGSPSHPLDISPLNFLDLASAKSGSSGFGQPLEGRCNRLPSVCSPSLATQVVRDSLHQFDFDLAGRCELELAQVSGGQV